MYHCIFVLFVSWHMIGQYLIYHKKSQELDYHVLKLTLDSQHLYVTEKRSCSKRVDRMSEDNWL